MKQLFFTVLVGLQLAGVVLSAREPQPSDAKDLGKQLMENLPGIFSLDQDHKERMGKYLVPPIRNGDWVLSNQPISLIESFAANTGTVATFFVRVEDEYIRISTTEPNEKAGTILDHSSPAYKRMVGELRYTGKVSLSGKEYMADYDVFRDRQGRVIGAYLVAIPL